MKNSSINNINNSSLHCVEHEKGKQPCGVALFMEKTDIALGQLMEFKTEATSKLNKIEDLEMSLQEVAHHAKSMDGTLKEMKDVAKELIGIATGKKHVPISVFFVVILALCALMLIDKLSSHRADLDLTPTQFKYRSNYYDSPNAEKNFDNR